ncbi:MAG: FliH/SctL family protein [Acetanaerobacterium sp.]
MPKIVKALNANFKESILIPSEQVQQPAHPQAKDPEPREPAETEPEEVSREAAAPLTDELRRQVLDAAHKEAEEVLSQSASKAQGISRELLEKAEREAQIIRDDARREGLSQGREQAEEQIQQKLNEVVALLDRIDDRQREIIGKTEGDLRLLAVEVVRKFMGKELREDDKALTGIVERALANYKNTDWIKITVSQTDAEVSCITDKGMLAEMLNVSGSIEIEVLSDASTGMCIVETPDGIADASIETQLCNLKQLLTRSG